MGYTTTSHIKKQQHQNLPLTVDLIPNSTNKKLTSSSMASSSISRRLSMLYCSMTLCSTLFIMVTSTPLYLSGDEGRRYKQAYTMQHKCVCVSCVFVYTCRSTVNMYVATYGRFQGTICEFNPIHEGFNLQNGTEFRQKLLASAQKKS